MTTRPSPTLYLLFNRVGALFTRASTLIPLLTQGFLLDEQKHEDNAQQEEYDGDQYFCRKDAIEYHSKRFVFVHAII